MITANLLEVLKKSRKTIGLKDLVLYGRVRCAIERPSVIGKDIQVSSGFFCIVDVYAIKCLGEDYFQGGISDSLCFVKGSVIAFLDEVDLVDKDIKLFGTTKTRGVTVKQQFNHSSMYDGITALCFKMSGNSNFVVVPNKAVELLEDDSSIRATELQDFVAKVVISKEGIEYPEELDAFTEFKGAESYKEIDVNTLKWNLQDKKKDPCYVDDERFIDVSKLKLNLTHNLGSIDESPMLDAVKEEVNHLSMLRYRYARDLKMKYKEYCGSEMDDDFNPKEHGMKKGDVYYGEPDIYDIIRTSFISEIASRYHERIGNTHTRYGSFVDEFVSSLSNMGWGGTTEKDDETKRSEVNNLKDKLMEECKSDPTCLYGEGKYSDLRCLTDYRKFASLVIGVLTGIGTEKIKTNASSCYRAGIGLDLWYYMLIRNPYTLGLLGTGLSVWDIDKIYYSFGRFFSGHMFEEEVSSVRNELLLLDTISGSIDNDSLLNEYSIKKSYRYNYNSMRLITLNGYPCKKENILAISTLLNRDICRYFNEYELTKSNPFTKERVKDLYENKGLLEEIDLKGTMYYALASDMEKEYIIYTTLYSKGQTDSGVTMEDVEKVISEFEEEKGFKLEQLQKDAMQLTLKQAGVLAGCAGSGKTTTSDCMTKIITEVFGDRYKLGYSTPTGKACRRLAEVVGGDVKTLHSRFGIGLGGCSYLGSVSKRPSTQSDKMVYFFDEMAMCNMDLLFEVCRNITDDDLVYFMGDVGQLPPIGRGNPFKLLMSILPCVELGVSKRAAEGSLVNYNCTILNHLSDSVVVELKYDDKTFIANECNDSEIPIKVTSMFSGFMSGKYGGVKYEEDDIQVITGYQKEGITFSTSALNTPLHSLLRKNDRVLYKYLDRDFCMGERVIHLRRNAYEMPRYTTTDKVTFTEEVAFGVVNGEMGKIIGVVRSDMCTFLPMKDKEEMSDIELEILDRRSEREVLDNSIFKSDKIYFVVVEIYDVDLKKNVVALYRANLVDDSTGILCFEGGDLSYLDYAYALTTHKMQGSQSKVVIAALGSASNPEFINRNMINTILTRSQGIVGIVGSIKGSESAINLGRRNKSAEYCKDILSILVGVPM